MSVYIESGNVLDFDTCQGCNRQEGLIEKGALRKDLPIFLLTGNKEGSIRLCRVCLKELKYEIIQNIYSVGVEI